MNRGSIPGYYFDEVKGKYFKIQPNHVAPPNAKYAKSNVKREQRETKKRKTEQRQLRKRLQQTVQHPRSTCDSLLAGAGLQREYGARSYSSYHVQRDLGMMQNLEPTETKVSVKEFDENSIVLLDAVYNTDTSESAFVICHGPTSYVLYHHRGPGDWTGRTELSYSTTFCAFRDPVVSTATTTIDGIAWYMACTSNSNHLSGHSGHTYFGTMGNTRQSDSVYTGEPGTVLLACKLNTTTCRHAIASSSAVLILPTGFGEPPQIYRLDPDTESFAIDWLDSQTVAFSTVKDLDGPPQQRRARKDCPPSANDETDPIHTVKLWDIRSQGVSTRLLPKRRVNGIETPDATGHNLIVTTNYDINLYDLRFVRYDRPALSFAHESETTRLHLDVYRNDLIVAVDRDNIVQTYSLRSGRHVAGLKPAHPGRGLIQQPRWYETPRGSPYIQACRRNSLLRWSWQGERDTG